MVKREPLLFIKTPPYYVRTSIAEVDESTSIFLKEEFLKDQTLNEQIDDQNVELINEQANDLISNHVDEKLFKQLQFLSKPIRQRLYQPLIICLNDGRQLAGVVSDVEKSSFIFTSPENFTQELVDMSNVLQILWRNRPFQMR